MHQPHQRQLTLKSLKSFKNKLKAADTGMDTDMAVDMLMHQHMFKQAHKLSKFSFNKAAVIPAQMLLQATQHQHQHQDQHKSSRLILWLSYVSIWN